MPHEDQFTAVGLVLPVLAFQERVSLPRPVTWCMG